MNKRLLGMGLVLVASSAAAEVKLPTIFGDHMVLQSGVGAPVWGWADKGDKVTVEIGSQKQTAVADDQGKWRVTLDAMPASSAPAELVVTSANQPSKTVKRSDILVGEVWLGSGQSNMAMTVGRAKDLEKEKAASGLPQIRVFTTATQNSPQPAADCKGEWKVCSAETVPGFSAAAFFFGREIHRELKVPVGLIVSAVGGTPIDSWVDKEKQESMAEMKGFFAAEAAAAAAVDPAREATAYEAAMEKWKQDVKQARADEKPLPRKPQSATELRARKSNLGGLFNGMIMPLVPYAIRGGLWYQGEANTVPTKAAYYQYQLPLLITDWRKLWGNEFPFAWVQLPNFAGVGRDLSQVREGMLKTLRLPKTGMAITIDIGETGNIHPLNKQEVGRRLAQWALATVYDKAGVESSGPLPAKHEVRGSEMVVHFSHAKGLTAKGGEVTGFLIAGEDQQWQTANARIEGESVVVASASVIKPVAVRYAWENDPKCNLFNGADIPASPFRTDGWKIPAPEQPKPRAPKKAAR